MVQYAETARRDGVLAHRKQWPRPEAPDPSSGAGLDKFTIDGTRPEIIRTDHPHRSRIDDRAPQARQSLLGA